MEEILKSDIFFFITAIAVVIITIVLLVAFYYVIKILSDIKDLAEIVKDEGEHIVDDIGKARKKIKRKGNSLMNIINNITSSKKKK